jgi:hypothetical protein
MERALSQCECTACRLVPDPAKATRAHRPQCPLRPQAPRGGEGTVRQAVDDGQERTRRRDWSGTLRRTRKKPFIWLT